MPKATSSTPACRNITKVDLERWSSLDERINELRAEANTLAAEQRGLEAIVEQFVLAKAGPSGEMTRSGYELAIREVKASVPWKNAFIDACGRDEARRLEESVGTKKKLEIKKL